MATKSYLVSVPEKQEFWRTQVYLQVHVLFFFAKKEPHPFLWWGIYSILVQYLFLVFEEKEDFFVGVFFGGVEWIFCLYIFYTFDAQIKPPLNLFNFP